VLPAVPRHPKKIPKSFIHRLVGQDDPLILEIGCNDGEDSHEFMQEFPEAELHCFECDERALKQFRERMYAHGDRMWKCYLHSVALSHMNGKALFNMSGGTRKGLHKQDWDLSGSLLQPKEHLKIHPWCTFDRQCVVDIRRLDDWADECIRGKTIDFVFMDVQGGEKLVFEGGQKTFLERTRFVYSEFSTVEEYAGQWLVSDLVAAFTGFHPVGIYEGRNVLLAKQ
jgi:FkbM family methyltransferase